MATFVMCAVYDRAVKAFNSPMFFRSVDEARRSFGDAVVDREGGFIKHPEDFYLAQLGLWHDAGKFELCDENKLCEARDFQPAS